jgi:hypothetical protein
MLTLLSALCSPLSFRVRSRASLEIELVALRRQVAVLHRQRPGLHHRGGRPELFSVTEPAPPSRCRPSSPSAIASPGGRPVQDPCRKAAPHEDGALVYLRTSSTMAFIGTPIPWPDGLLSKDNGMGIVAKRIELVPHSEPPKIVIKSINPEYQTYERDGEEVNIIGRVIWAAKRL